MQSAFSLIGSGINFDKRKFRSDLLPFKAAGKTEKPRLSLCEKSELVDYSDAVSFKKNYGIRTYGNDVPPPLASFDEIVKDCQDPSLIEKLSDLGYILPTPIQMQAIPSILAGRDIMACSPTGSGKTISYILPFLKVVRENPGNGIRGLILVPTRELAVQIARELQRFSRNATKVSILSNSNVASKEKRYDVLLSTPALLAEAIERGRISLACVKVIVFDEADKLFELGFIEKVDSVIAACTLPCVQKCFFSATISSHVEILANSVTKDPIRITIGLKNSAATDVAQQLKFVGQEGGKLIAINNLLNNGVKPPVLIFVESSDRAKQLFQDLSLNDKFKVDVIHSERSPAQRDAVIKDFRLGNIWVLVSTEILGRGLDFKGINLVINYDIPRTLSSYIHRIGRTGRAGRKGCAITYFTKEDAPKLRGIANAMKESGNDVSEWMLELPKARSTRKRFFKVIADSQEKKQRQG